MKCKFHVSQIKARCWHPGVGLACWGDKKYQYKAHPLMIFWYRHTISYFVSRRPRFRLLYSNVVSRLPSRLSTVFVSFWLCGKSLATTDYTNKCLPPSPPFRIPVKSPLVMGCHVRHFKSMYFVNLLPISSCHVSGVSHTVSLNSLL